MCPVPAVDDESRLFLAHAAYIRRDTNKRTLTIVRQLNVYILLSLLSTTQFSSGWTRGLTRDKKDPAKMHTKSCRTLRYEKRTDRRPWEGGGGGWE